MFPPACASTIVLDTLGGGDENAICRICSHCTRRNAGAWLYWHHLQTSRDYKVAVRDLYLSTVGCVHYSGEKMAGHMHYPKGAMGVHFVNLTIRGTPNPMKPNILIYRSE